MNPRAMSPRTFTDSMIETTEQRLRGGLRLDTLVDIWHGNKLSAQLKIRYIQIIKGYRIDQLEKCFCWKTKRDLESLSSPDF